MPSIYELIAATVTGAAGYCITNFVMQPILHYKKVRQETACELIIFANAIAALPSDKDVQQTRVFERMTAQRKRSAELLAAYVCLPRPYIYLLHWLGENPADAASELLGLSNTSDQKDGVMRMQNVQRLLRLPRIAA